MSPLSEKLLEMSYTASWMIFAVILLRLLFRRAPKQFRVYWWALVGLRLILPFSFKTGFSLIPSLGKDSPQAGSAPSAVPAATEAEPPTEKPTEPVTELPAEAQAEEYYEPEEAYETYYDASEDYQSDNSSALVDIQEFTYDSSIGDEISHAYGELNEKVAGSGSSVYSANNFDPFTDSNGRSVFQWDDTPKSAWN